MILSHAGKSNDEIAAALNLHRNTVGKRRRRFIADGLKAWTTFRAPAGPEHMIMLRSETTS
ncbi:MAG: helix-turn-helix domain-containing protein [Deltaproteobacteria bacterium]|nr:helix-turn-helix domain-containing protein [Deltaproteobacteria bacterium]